MDKGTIVLFTRNGLGDAGVELQQTLAKKFLGLLLEGGSLPGVLLFYTDGVKLACTGSPVLEELKALEKAGVHLVLCQTCLNQFKLADQVQMGIVGGMGDILEAMNRATKVISV